MKYPPLEEPCKSCYLKCGRVEDPTFVKDEKCKYAEKENKYEQEEVWKTK